MRRTIFIVMLMPVFAFAQTPKLNIRLAHGYVEEMKKRQQIERLAEHYDLSKYTITRDLVIEERAINHAAPVLTLNLLFLDNDDRALGVYVHEQGHWVLMTRHRNQTRDMFEELTKLYPNIRIDPPYGDGNRRTSYMHLPVIMLEWQALEDLLGVARARAVMKRANNYTDLFATVIDHRPQMEDFLKRYDVKW